MTRVAPGVIQAHDLSTAWLETVDMVAAAPKHLAFHTFTSIASPLDEVPSIRLAIDSTLAHRRLPGVETVAGTIFPKGLAAQCGNAEELAGRYNGMYNTLKRFPGNAGGTYFGRIVAHPDSNPPMNQLSRLIEKLVQESASQGPMSARYEVILGSPQDALLIKSPHRNDSRMGFPCLSMCSVQLEADRVHLLAHYRSQELIEKGYGNYLGLARLQSYVAHQAGLEPGRLTIVAGRIHADSGSKFLRARLGSTTQH